jgi:ribosomal protein S13
MARISELTYKITESRLPKIKGLGWALSREITKAVGIDPKNRMKDLSADSKNFGMKNIQ